MNVILSVSKISKSFRKKLEFSSDISEDQTVILSVELEGTKTPEKLEKVDETYDSIEDFIKAAKSWVD